MTAHLRQAWAARIGAAEYTVIARGLLVDCQDLTMAKKIRDGRATFQDIMSLISDPVGRWWGLIGRDFGMEDITDFATGEAGSEELAKKWLEVYEEEVAEFEDATFIAGQVEVVMVAERPEGWEPENNPLIAGGAMGNSYVNPGTRIKLIEVRYNAGWGWKTLPARGHTVTAGLSYDPDRDLPPNKPGTQPVPSGSVRAFHYTAPRNIPSILSQGLRGSFAQQFDYDGEGIWAAAGVPKAVKEALAGHEVDRIWIEFWTPIDKLYIGGGSNVSASSLEQRNSHIVSPDVPVSHFLGIYLPWHFAYWYMSEDARTREEVLKGTHDNMMDDRDYKDSYGRAVKLIKQKFSMKTGASNPNVTIDRFNDGGMLGRPIQGGEWDARTLHNFAIDLDGKQVGVAQVFAPDAEHPEAVIAWINVVEQYRRKGVATAAHKLLGEFYKAKVVNENLTDLGRKWWKTL